jgi:hypothetical protein
VDKFFKKLAKFKGKFYLTALGRLRETDTFRCPLVAVAGGSSSADNCGAVTLARKIPLSYTDAAAVVCAADRPPDRLPSDHTKELRRRLLRVLGLKERKKTHA